jgi:Uma2 family endonuclease
MVESGVFRDDPEGRIELIYGEIREMVHPGPLHEDIVDLLTEWSFAHVDLKQIRVRVEKTLGISELDSIPRPDIAWVRQQSYSDSRPTPGDVLLVIEVSDTRLSYDAGPKSRLYAEAGIPEYWIVNVRKKSIEVFRNPSKQGYQSEANYSVRDKVSPLALPSAKLAIKTLFQ